MTQGFFYNLPKSILNFFRVTDLGTAAFAPQIFLIKRKYTGYENHDLRGNASISLQSLFKVTLTPQNLSSAGTSPTEFRSPTLSTKSEVLQNI